ncbi:cation-translocating P-type ATPase [Nocardioides daeguensis]|uniref:Cation-transporting P-type ATPase n=1 Tax=Nocardioides daeguensis TaxID=908359 RepID=A0ABP6UQG4_9ACTN|nr:cation-transporting P-type ATPase [Nocardioides daeguensis]MBV6728322.1 cation-transporting P-type ATPase [Nocardioides daeguensis]MCR1773131.1 cation-transporting P-type ATPase [Nocardioides daeguensis]
MTDASPAAPAGALAGGLDEQQVEESRRAHGANVVPPARRRPAWRLLVDQMTHLLAVLLWVAAGLAVIAGMPELGAAISVIVVLNALFAFWQEFHADRSTERLRALLPVRARVMRAGRLAEVDVTDLVVDDVVLLDAGDRVGADLQVITAKGLALDESMLTGESAAVPHDVGDLLMSGTFLTQGTARARVVAVGRATTLAGISRLSEGAERPPSPLTVQLRKVVRVIAVVAFTVGIGLGVGSLALGLDATEAFLFGVGVSVALVPEGLLPTVTLSLARGAQRMASEHALVRRLDAVETLGATTFICTDKTGTITQNRMNVVTVVTPSGRHDIAGDGYAPTGRVTGTGDPADLRQAALSGLRCVTGRIRERDGTWAAVGDPMEAALHALALRVGAPVEDVVVRRPYTAERMLSSAWYDGQVAVLGAPEAVLGRCRAVPDAIRTALADLTSAGLRVLAVAGRAADEATNETNEHDLELHGLLGLQDPPRPDVGKALGQCRRAGIRVAMLTGDHPSTAQAIARQVGLLHEGGVVVEGRDLPDDDHALADLLDCEQGAVVARVAPADKLRIARALRGHGHVVAMTGDGVNDAPALRMADVGVAMGASGSDVAREAADLVLLDDHFATIVTAVELGRATTQNVRRFLTFHLTDNVAELAPFAAWALSGGNFPLAISVLQVLALDIGTDILPALALGAEPGRADVMRGRRRRTLIDRALAVRAFLVLGLTEAVLALAAFTAVLLTHGWRWGDTPSSATLALASGTAFAVIAGTQVANAFACRSTRLPVWRLDLLGNRLVLAAVAAEVVLLLVFLGVPDVAELLGGSFPDARGWLLVLAAAGILLLVDGLAKSLRRTKVPAGTGAATLPVARTPREARSDPEEEP